MTASGATTFRHPSGSEVTLDGVLASAEGKPVLLAFFKTSCPTCKLAWPYVQRLHEAYGADGVRVVGVSQNDATASQAFYRDFGGARFDLLLDPEPAFAASNAFEVETVPHLVLLNPDGTSRRSFSGWQRQKMESLGSEISTERGLPFVPVVAPDDPVPSSKPG